VSLKTFSPKKYDKETSASWRAFSIAWSFIAVALSLWLTIAALRGIKFDADLLALLPKDEQHPSRVAATSAFMRQVSQKVALLVAAPSFEEAAKAAEMLGTQLREASEFDDVQARLSQDILTAYQALLFPHVTQLYSQEFEELLNGPHPDRALSDRTARILFSPLSGSLSASLAEDPLLIYADVLQNLPRPPGKMSVRNGYLVTPLPPLEKTTSAPLSAKGLSADTSQVAVLVTASLKATVFDRASQQAASARLDAAKSSTLSAFPSSTIYEIGALRFAQAMAGSAEHDLTLISIGSLIGTVALVLIVFSSLTPLLLSLLSVGMGIVVALSSCLLLFGDLHLITLGLGASLIGVCADYSFHFFCHRLAAAGVPSLRVLRSVLPAISVGIGTSIIGFSGLLFVSFPGLQEIAVFSIAGMLGSFLSVAAWLPLLPPVALGSRQPAALLWCKHALKLTQVPRVRRWAGGTAVALLPLLLLGLVQSQPSDDIRALQRPPQHLLEDEAHFRGLVGGSDGSRFFVVTGSSSEEILKRQDDLIARLRSLVRTGALGSFQSVGNFVPSESTQRRRSQLLRDVILEHKLPLQAQLSELGLPEHTFDEFITSLSGSPPSPLSLADWRKSEASRGLRQLWVQTPNAPPASIIPLQGIYDAPRVQEAARPEQGVFFYDQVADTAQLMERYRKAAAGVSLACYGLVFCFLLYRYGARLGTRGMVPALASVVATTAALGLIGQPITLFSVLANVIVLGLAIDYSVFLLEGFESAGPTMLAIALSTITTVLSFGFLALSSTAVLSSFGLTLFVGVIVSMFTAPFIIRSGAA